MTLSPERRVEIATKAARVRWQKQPPALILDMRLRADRRVKARQLAEATGGDPGTIEQVLFLNTLDPWERLARGRRRSLLGTVRRAARC
jgi:hypothetical protein